jgi:hypothetical protein
MSDAREAAKKGLEAALAAVRHTGWWVLWRTDRRARREIRELGVRPQGPPVWNDRAPSACVS